MATSNSIIDLSHHNGGRLNFAKAKADGIVGVIQKATQGEAYVDPTFSRNKAAVLEAELLFGAYHFGTGSNGISAYDSSIRIASSTVSNLGESGVYLYGSTSTMNNLVIDGARGWSGIYAQESSLAVATSAIENVSKYGIALYDATSTISNTLVQAGGGDGILVYQGTAEITNTSVADFTQGAGVRVYSPTNSVSMSGGEVAGNAQGISSSPGSVVLNSVLVHDNGASAADNVVTQ